MQIWGSDVLNRGAIPADKFSEELFFELYKQLACRPPEIEKIFNEM